MDRWECSVRPALVQGNRGVKPKGFVGGGIDNLEDIDTHAVSDYFHLVDSNRYSLHGEYFQVI